MQLGTAAVSKFYLGANVVDKVMLGAGEVWSSVFNPLSLSPVIWLDSSTPSTLWDSVGNPVATGGAVVTWRDKSPAARHALTVTSGGRPIRSASFLQNGIAGILFDGVDDALNCGTGGPSRATVFAVARRDEQNPDVGSAIRVFASNWSATGGAKGWFFGTGRPSGSFGNNVLLCYHSPDTVDQIAGSAGYGGTEGDVPNNTNLILTAFAKTNPEVWKNGTLIDTGTTTETTPNADAQMWIGGHFQSTARHFKGVIWELLIYPTTLSTTDRQAVERYLGAKWGISVA